VAWNTHHPLRQKATGTVSRKHGHLYCWKVTKNFGQCVNFSAREIEHGRFRALFAASFSRKMQNGRTSPKSKKN
jgi:hypothetical protein